MAVSITPIKDDAGRIIAFRCIVRDRTERRKAEEKSREIEERYKALIDRSLDFIYTIDFEGRFIDANEAALRRFDYKREDISSLNITSFLDEKQILSVIKIMQELTETGTQKELAEIKLRHKDGSYVYVESKGSVVMSDGKPVAYRLLPEISPNAGRQRKRSGKHKNRCALLLTDCRQFAKKNAHTLPARFMMNWEGH